MTGSMRDHLAVTAGILAIFATVAVGLVLPGHASAATAQLWQTNPGLDGQVYGRPVVFGSRVYVATENDTVYAFDAATGALVWQKSAGRAVPGGVLPCGNVNPVGISSTPVIDPATGTLYVVAETWDGSNPASIAHQLVGFSTADGSVVPGTPVSVDPAGGTPSVEFQLAGLALDGGNVVIAYGGLFGSCGSYHGWVVTAPEAGGPLDSYEVDSGAATTAAGSGGRVPRRLSIPAGISG